jgi:hypothetical protein
MSIPTVYTELTLAQYMHSLLGKMAAVLSFAEPTTEPGVYQEAVNEVMLALGVSDLECAPDIRKVRALATREAWKLALDNLATAIDYSADGSRYDRSQLSLQAQATLNRAISDCFGLGIGMENYTASITTIEYQHDPYQYPKEVEE